MPEKKIGILIFGTKHNVGLKEGKKLKVDKNENAPAGNRTQVCTVAGYYSTTRPLVLVIINLGSKSYLVVFKIWICLGISSGLFFSYPIQNGDES